MNKDIYLSEVVGTWQFVCSKTLLPKRFCYEFNKADSVRNIILNFKTDFTHTYTMMDTAGFPYSPQTVFGKGKLDTLFRSSYPNSDLYLSLKSPKGGKIYMGFRSIDYAEGYFKKL